MNDLAKVIYEKAKRVGQTMETWITPGWALQAEEQAELIVTICVMLLLKLENQLSL